MNDYEAPVLKDERRSQISQRLWNDPVYRDKMLPIRKEQGKKRIINDGLNRWQRYRLKDLNGYRKKKREYVKTESQREKRRLYGRAWRARNRELYNARAKIYHQKHKHKHVLRNANYHLSQKYGIGLVEYQAMLDSQNGGCYLCMKKPTGRRLHVDHDHKTGKVRRILCSTCNRALGVVEFVGLQKVCDYLELGK